MTEEEINIAIAESEGWLWVEGVIAPADGWKNPTTGEISDDPDDLPKYTEDLNAMHEAEKVLTWGQMGQYCGELDDLETRASHGIHATAAQRAEAFLKTLNLWKNE